MSAPVTLNATARSGRRRLLLTALAVLVLLAAARPLVAPIDDPDFFWHLATGTWIWEHKALPQHFLFSRTSPETMTDAQHVTMTSYWAVQVLYHLLHSRGGLTAIVLLRAALAAVLIAAVAARCAWRDPLASLAAVLLGTVVLQMFPFERPQVFSFVFFSLLLLALDRQRGAPAALAPPLWSLLAPPLLMIVWANCHGAFIVGQGTLVLCLATEGLKFAHPALGPLTPRRYRQLLGTGALGILAAFVNPNTYHVFRVARLPEWAKSANLEYLSTVAYFRVYGEPVVIVAWALLALTLAGFALPRRIPDLTSLALVAGTGFVAFGEMRHLPFFTVCAVPVVAWSLSSGAWARVGRAALLAAAFAAGVFLLPGDLENMRQFRAAHRVSHAIYPVDAADFLLSRPRRGDPYTFWPWGGYLLWRLAPAETFIDGRNSSQEIFLMNAAVESGDDLSSPAGPPWRLIFKTYGIHSAVLPIFNPRGGEVLGLLFALGRSPDWAPVFIGVNSVVFVENTPDGRWAVPLPFASPEQFFAELAGRCEALAGSMPADPFPRIGRGDLLARLRRFDEARGAYEEALRLVPLNPLARERLAALPPPGSSAPR